MTIEAAMSTPRSRPQSSGRLLIAVASSVLVGLVSPLLLALTLAAGGGESRMTGAALLGWAAGWALIAVLSVRFTGHPQRWAFVPAAIFGGAGLALVALAPDMAALDALAWIWPVPVLVLVAWLFVRVRRELAGPSRWLLMPVVLVLALLAVGGAGEALAASAQGAPPVDGGSLVDVGGHRLFITCAGTGSPTVVLEAGLGEGAAYFARILPDVASTTRVCAYDRAGRGSSEPGPEPQDGMTIARDLHALLAASGNPGPYILAAHSSGGVYVRFFAAAYPKEVAGMVLLDAQSPAGTPRSAASAPRGPVSTLFGILPALARVGVARVLAAAESYDLPTDVSARLRALESTPRGVASFAEEFAMLGDSVSGATVLPDLGDVPLVVVTAVTDAADGWLPQQDHLATLSTNVSHRVMPDLTHNSLLQTPSGAAAASDAIISVVTSVRTGTRL